MLSAENVMRHYSVQSSQKTIDWLAFGGTCCMIYGTRFGAYMLRRRSEQQEKTKPGAVLYTMPSWKGTEGQVRGGPVRETPQQPAPQPQAETHIAVEMEFENQE